VDVPREKGPRELIRDKLYAKFQEILAEVETYPSEAESKKGETQVTLRRKEGGVFPESGGDLVVFERRDMGVTPEQLISHYRKVQNLVKDSGVFSLKAYIGEEAYGESGELAETYVAIFKIPFVDARMMVNTKYWIPNESIVIISGLENEAVKETYIKDQNMVEGRDFVLATVYLSAHKFIPIYDPKDPSRVIGTHTLWVDESNLRIAMPRWMMKKQQPKGMTEGFEKMLEEIKRKQT
jgi:hypothetical protein